MIAGQNGNGYGDGRPLWITGLPESWRSLRWQERFAQEGYDGLLRDKTRPSRIPPLGPEVAERVA